MRRVITSINPNKTRKGGFGNGTPPKRGVPGSARGANNSSTPRTLIGALSQEPKSVREKREMSGLNESRGGETDLQTQAPQGESGKVNKQF